MHPNPAFRGTETAQSLAFAAARGFGILTLNGTDAPLLAHIPFLITDDGQAIDLHLARSNAIARALSAPAPALLAVTGPDAYISPDWYGAPDMVPTWNYVAVHIHGQLERRPNSELPGLLARQSHAFERRLAPKPEWKMDKLSDDAMMRLLRMIVPFRLTITDIQSTWKLGQNRTPEQRLAAADGVAEAGIGSETDDLARLMRGV